MPYIKDVKVVETDWLKNKNNQTIHTLCTILWIYSIWAIKLCWTNRIVHQSHMQQYTIQNRNVHISSLNGILWVMGQVHYGVYW